jgi:hypothetical protein
MMESEDLRGQFDRLQRGALLAGAAALLVCGYGLAADRAQFFQSYLYAFVFWTGLALGSLALLMVHHLFGAGWGFIVQRVFEAATRTFPVLALLFVPLLFGLHDLYEWTHAEAVAADATLQHKAPYLNVPFFVGRAAFYLALWVGAGFLLSKMSRELDGSRDPHLALRLRNLSAPGLLVFGLTATFASVDWVMSLEPHWFSTMFGLISIGGQVLGALALAILVATKLSAHPPLSVSARPQHFHDLGNLLLAFTMIWAYLSFSQFLIIWSGNLPETIFWYQHRSTGGWETLALGLVALNFALPFMLLLSRQAKRRAQTLAGIAALILAMRLADLHWQIAPSFHPEGFRIAWLDAAAIAGIGGVWLAYFVHQLKSRPLLPEGDPRMQEAFAHAGEH